MLIITLEDWDDWPIETCSMKVRQVPRDATFHLMLAGPGDLKWIYKILRGTEVINT
jgi:hypothetical protein